MPHPEHSIPTSFRRVGLASLLIGGLVCGGLLTWAAVAELDAGAVAQGEVVPAGLTKTIQHFEGGIVTEIRVRDGDAVRAGDELLRLDDSEPRAMVTILENEQNALTALVERLTAERDGRSHVTAAPQASAGDAQLRLFEARRSELARTIGVLEQRIVESKREQDGLAAQRAALSRMVENTGEEVRMAQDLQSRGFVSRNSLLTTQTRAEAARSEIGKTDAESARARQKAAEAEIEIGRLKTAWMRDVLEELRKADEARAANAERVRVARQKLARTRVVAPQDGVVQGLRYVTVGGVVTPGAAILDIVPTSDRLVVEAHIAPDDIDVVHPGLASHVRLSAYKSRTHRALDGRVVQVSADTFRDPQRGIAFYKARIEIPQSRLADIDRIALQPGMLAQVEIVSGRRSVLRYLFDPLIDSLDRAFKEQ